MKLIKILRNLESQLSTKLRSNEVIYKSIIPIGILCLAAEVIWIIGPHIVWNDFAPLAQSEKRIYAIVFIFLAWLLKFLIIDLDKPNAQQQKNMSARKRLQELQSRFHGATKFLNTNTTPRHGKNTRLSGLPWYLLIGPANAGKTTLLASSNVHFVLQKQFPNQDMHKLSTSEHCDWWVTREASIIDVPGKYLSASDGMGNTHQGSPLYVSLWLFFLRLIKKYRGKKGIDGIIVTLPAPDIIKLNDTKSYTALLRDLFQRIHEIQKIFPHPLSCQIIITKCDLLPGFKEFFAESSNEETAQAWGVNLTAPKDGQKITEAFSMRFNALIKKMNQQLIWRLHQERNPMARPYIKDFPLQVERIKEFTLDFIKKLSSVRLNIALQGVYMTSAIQPEADTEENTLDQPVNSSARAVQIFKEPTHLSRAYFVKHFLTYGIGHSSTEYTPALNTNYWKARYAYAASIGLVALTVVMLGKDFQQGVKQSYAIQKNLSEYEFKFAQIQDPTEHLIGSIHLLNTLQASIANDGFAYNLSSLLSFYSHKSQQKANEAYQQTLQALLLPEIKSYFEEYLTHPVNKNADDIYAVLKAYLMMGDATYFDANHISMTLQKILPKSLSDDDSLALSTHLKTALTSYWTPLSLNAETIQGTRKFLLALPELKLGYLILKNLDNNNSASEISLTENKNITSMFSAQKMSSYIPAMFTAKSFHSILSQEVNLAAQEASMGNWVLGHEKGVHKNAAMTEALIAQLRSEYINNYVEFWENLLANLRLSSPSDLTQTDAMIVSIISNNSPLLYILQMIHDNTNFEPVITSSPKLQNLNSLVDKTTDSHKTLYEIFASMQSLHQYLQTVLSADNEKQAAYNAVSSRMLSRGIPDAITQVRLIAEKSPAPIRQWLAKISNDSWDFLMQEAGQYLDLSWQNEVIQYYQTDIAEHYPFSANATKEVNMQKFIKFFGNPGIVLSYYNKYLQRFVDTSTADWHWKKIEGQAIPFSEETLRQIQHAMRIHKSFFPNGDNKLFVQFALQPYEFGKSIRSVKLSINDKQFIDDSNSKNTHTISWPSDLGAKMTSIQLNLNGQASVSRHYPGQWGWFKLINQSFESMMTKKEILLNLSVNESPAKYVLTTEGRYNPFMSLNLQHFHLPQQLTDERA